MAFVTMTLEQARAAAQVDVAKVDATTEEDIRRHMMEDGEDPDAPSGDLRRVVPPALIRERLGMSQKSFAKALRIPLATLRNWEQNRTKPDLVTTSFFALVDDDPERAFAVLNRFAKTE